MVSNGDMQTILEFVRTNKKKIIIVGDNYQLPCPSGQLVKINSNPDSLYPTYIEYEQTHIFKDDEHNHIKLTEIVRQCADSKIKQLCVYIRDHFTSELDIYDIIKNINLIDKNIELIKTHDESNINVEPNLNKSDINESDLNKQDINVEPNLNESERMINYFVSIGDSDRLTSYLESLDLSNESNKRIESCPLELYIIDKCNIAHEYVNHFRQTNSTKIICYTNLQVMEYNELIRQHLMFVGMINDMKHPHVNEILMGYNNNEIINNGREYVISNISPSVKLINIKGINVNVYGHSMSFIDVESKIFIVDINADNKVFIAYMIELTNIINTKKASKQEYFIYKNIRKTIFFMDDIYVYDDEIYNLWTFKKQHELLFKHIDLTSSSDIQTLYPGLYSDIIALNNNKMNNDLFSDRYKVIDKDLYYSYAITIHKSQGSTYDHVFADVNLIQNIQSYKWNTKWRLYQNNIRYKNQLLYVACSRPSKTLYVI
jgi:hypothetical protein